MRSTEGYITAEGGVRLFYRTVGEGPVAVIVPNGLQLIDDFTRLMRSENERWGPIIKRAGARID